MKNLLTNILAKIYVMLIGKERKCHTTVSAYKGKAYVITVEEYHSTEEFIQLLSQEDLEILRKRRDRGISL